MKVDVSGGVPTEGSTITVIDGQVKKVNLIYETSTIMKNIKGTLVLFENEYEIGDEITFNPGDGNKTWNVISETPDTVTLMLNSNLGNNIQWYAPEENNSYGPITALNYLNTLTTNWANVDPIEEFVYINNKGGTALPNGYQKIEIIDGKTKIISKTGEENNVLGETKARILTLEEVFSVAQTLYDNYKEENLEAYIERHLDAFSALSGQTLTTVDQAIEFLTIYNNIFQYDSRILILFNGVSIGIENGLEDYDLTIPTLTQDLNQSDSYRYWLLNSRPAVATSSMQIKYDGIFYSDYTYVQKAGVRPVITILKTKLN